MRQGSQVGYELVLMVDGISRGCVYVRSKDLAGLHLIGRSFREMKEAIAIAIKRLFRDNHGKDVNVIFVSDVSSLFRGKRFEAGPDPKIIVQVQQAA